MSLTILEAGTTAIVTRIRGGHGIRAHLLRLGIVPGVPVRKMQGGRGGPQRLEVLGTKVVLGQQMAEAIELG